jgi:thymidine kinase
MAKLYFYYSAMNAGKSTMLLQSNYNYNERGMETLIFLPAFDDRAGVGKIASRIGLEANAFTFDKEFNFLTYVTKALQKNPNIKCVLLDEAQFLTRAQVAQLADIADNCRIPVLCYGLRTDFRGELFEGSQYLLSWAQELIEIKTICHCGSKATMVLRTDQNGKVLREGEQVVIGGNDRYVSVCHKHHVRGEIAKTHPAQ